VAADPVDDPPWQALRDIFDPRLDWPGPA
jgi:hypothetical protein